MTSLGSEVSFYRSVFAPLKSCKYRCLVGR